MLWSPVPVNTQEVSHLVGKRVDLVLVKLCAVIVVVITLQNLTTDLAYYVISPHADFVLIMAVVMNFALPMLIAAALWFFPATIIGPVSNQINSEPAEPDWTVIAVTLIGLYVLIFGLIDLLYYESFRIAERDIVDPDRVGFYSPSPDSVAGRITSIVQSAIGLLLLAGKRGIARLITAARGRS